ncbi:Uncharacterised protein [Mycolicibacterium aurum]|uniref:Uncharacterized protein n=1 Tax=Mycolicibacterium aurum TaxID=1791 RepID=A0A3S4TXY8_MYCAU|nr:Uncharacterised protein [Mycolicibacterium aurum]
MVSFFPRWFAKHIVRAAGLVGHHLKCHRRAQVDATRIQVCPPIDGVATRPRDKSSNCGLRAVTEA